MRGMEKLSLYTNNDSPSTPSLSCWPVTGVHLAAIGLTDLLLICRLDMNLSLGNKSAELPGTSTLSAKSANLFCSLPWMNGDLVLGTHRKCPSASTSGPCMTFHPQSNHYLAIIGSPSSFPCHVDRTTMYATSGNDDNEVPSEATHYQCF